ncbi:NADPH-dependent F420 reductase [Amorphus sp. MBR-141]
MSASDTDRPTKIGVIGAGWLGGTVGRALAEAGHEVVFASRHPESLSPLTDGLRNARAGTPQEAAAFGDVVLFATPYDALASYGRTLSAELRGKIVLDATNPRPDKERGRSAYERGVAQTSTELLPGTRLVRCFSAVDATCIGQQHGYSEREALAVPLASDDKDALAVASDVVRDTGCIPVVTGGLASSRIFQRGGPGFRANTGERNLRILLEPLPFDG